MLPPFAARVNAVFSPPLPKGRRIEVVPGIPAEKPVVMQAFQTGALRPGKRPVNSGSQTHVDLARWAGVDQLAPPPNG
jgi:hypothetical protein